MPTIHSVPSSQRQEFGLLTSHGSELGDCKVVYVLGMLEGVLPRRPREDPILGDSGTRRAFEASREVDDSAVDVARRKLVHEREEFMSRLQRGERAAWY